MPFPPAERVIYTQNPIELVTCRLDFPPILKIDSDVPHMFQELIRAEFPIYDEIHNATMSLDISAPLLGIPISQLSGLGAAKNHVFTSEDDNWKVELSRSSVALVTRDYGRWEIFEAKLCKLLQGLSDIYKPSYYTRVGLRYIDLFKRSKLGLSAFEWKDLIEEPFCGILASDISKHAKMVDTIFDIHLNDSIGTATIATKTRNDASNEECFTLDIDFWDAPRVETDEAIAKLRLFNKHSTNLMQFAIKSKLHDAMEPKKP